MKKRLGLMATAFVMMFCGGLFAQTDILTVIPEKALVAAVAKDADASDAHLQAMIQTLVPEMEKMSPLRKMLEEMNLRARVKDLEDKDSSIDMHGPMAMVVVAPALDVPGSPVALVVKAADYTKLMAALATVLDVPGAEVTPDGTDVLRGDRHTIFAAKLGDFVVLSDAEYVVQTFKADAVAQNGPRKVDALFKSLVEKNDAAVMVNLKEVLATFGPQIEFFKKNMMQQMKAGGGMPPNGMTPEATAKVLKAEIEGLLKLGGQTDTVCAGVNFSAEGARLAMYVQPTAGTEFAKFDGMLKGGQPEQLTWLDGPFLAAGSWGIEPDAMKEAEEVMMGFLQESGLLEDKAGETAKTIEVFRKMMDMNTGHGAMVLMPPTQGQGILRVGSIQGLKPGSDARAVFAEYILQSMGLKTLGGGLKTNTKVEPGIEVYRGCVIDRVTVTFEQNPDAPEGANMKQMLAMFEMMYGPSMVVYSTQAKDQEISTVCCPNTDAIKKLIDRANDRKGGDLTKSEVWQTAMKGLPTTSTMSGAVSLAEFYRNFMGIAMAQFGPELKDALDNLKFEKPSALGLCVVASDGNLAVHCNVPMQEMQNVKALIQTMTQVMMQNMMKNMNRGGGRGNVPPPEPVQPAQPQ